MAEGAAEKLRHINGDVTHPIFGIDSDVFPPSDPRYIFTKTYRRMALDSQSSRHDESFNFSNAVVFGHSLCKADHNYFSLF